MRKLLILVTFLEMSAVANAEWNVSCTLGVNVCRIKTGSQQICDILKKIDDELRNVETALGVEVTVTKEQADELNRWRGEDIYKKTDGDFVSSKLLDELFAADYDVTNMEIGFGSGNPRNFDSINDKVNKALNKIVDLIRPDLAEAGLTIEQEPKFEAVDPDKHGIDTSTLGMAKYSTVKIAPLTVVGNSGQFRFGMMRGFDKIQQFYDHSFYDEDALASAIRSYIRPKSAEILKAYHETSTLPARTKSGLTIGISATYSHSHFSNEYSEFGVYTGVECFGQLTPKMNTNGTKVTEIEAGIRPVIGIDARDKWRLFGLFGIKIRRLQTKSKLIKNTKTKPAFEFGIGSEFRLSQKHAIGLKVIKTFKQSKNVNYHPLEVTSTKILLSFVVRI